MQRRKFSRELKLEAARMVCERVTCSMSRSGNVWDNAAIEGFFSSLKTERIGKKIYCTRAQAKADVLDYIECFLQPDPASLDLGLPQSYRLRT